MAYDEYQSVELSDRPAAMAINVLITLITALYLRLSRHVGGRRGP